MLFRSDDISELLNIKGVTPQMYWGPQGAGYMPRLPRAKRGAMDEEPAYKYGLKDLFSTFPRQINKNTAPRHIFSMILAGGMEGALPPEIEQFLNNRFGPDGVPGTEDDQPDCTGAVSFAGATGAGGVTSPAAALSVQVLPWTGQLGFRWRAAASLSVP